MVINKKVSKMKKFFILQVEFFLLKFIGTVSDISIISSHVITKSFAIIFKYLSVL